MSGVFAKWQPKYAARGIATFPIGEAKKPAIKGWPKVGLKYSTALATKFTDADAFGYVTGRPSNVTVLDIDTTEEKIAEDAIRKHGQPTIITRTASGKLHCLYRYNGERRRIRPWGGGIPIDVLGDNGYVLAPPASSKKAAMRLFMATSTTSTTSSPWQASRIFRPLSPPAACRACASTTDATTHSSRP